MSSQLAPPATCTEFPDWREVVRWPEGNWDPHLTVISVLPSVTACVQGALLETPDLHRSSTKLTSHRRKAVQNTSPQKR